MLVYILSKLSALCYTDNSCRRVLAHFRTTFECFRAKPPSKAHSSSKTGHHEQVCNSYFCKTLHIFHFLRGKF
jgi:hypothetical protein